MFTFLVILGSLLPDTDKKTKAARDSGAALATDASTTETQLNPELQWVTPSQIVSEYEANELAADKMYKGKKIGVKGSVEEISNDITDSPYVILTDHGLRNGDDPLGGLREVQAHFSDEDKDALAQLRHGQQLSVACKVQGLMMHVQLDDCRISGPPAIASNER